MANRETEISISRTPASDDSMADKIHKRLLEIMKGLHQVCTENHITYYMVGGTALGARRHQGFIPWDDDVDVGMPRPDYERFAALSRDKFPNFLELRWYQNTEDSPFQFIKLVDNRTTLIETLYANYVEGLYIDVFPLDGTGEDRFFEKMRRKKIWALHGMIIHRCSTQFPNAPLKRVAVKLIKKMNLDRMHERLEKELLSSDYGLCPKTANFLGAWKDREVMEKRVFGKPVLYKFEDTEFYGPQEMDEYLTNLYGDFMTPPPPEKRVFRHNYPFLDFEVPFREYEEKMRRK